MKKFATLLMALSLTLCLAACGGGTPAPQNDAAESNAAEESAQTPEETAPEAEETASEPEEFLWKGCRMYVAYMLENENPNYAFGLTGKEVDVCLASKEGLLDFNAMTDVKDFQLKSLDGSLYNALGAGYRIYGHDGEESVSIEVQMSSPLKGIVPSFDVPKETPLSDLTLVVQSDEGEREISLANVTMEEMEPLPDPADAQAVAEPVDAPSEPAAEWTTVSPGKLTMSTNAAFPPYEMTTDAGGFEGIDVEIAEALAAKLGLELQIDDMDFNAALQAVQSGKSDMVMAGVTVTEERKGVMLFSDTYSTGVQVIIVKDGSEVTLENLGDHMIGTQMATTGYQYCSGDYGEAHVTAYDNAITAVQALLNGQVDCVVIDNEPAKALVAQNPGLKILDTEYIIEDYAIGMRKENPELLEAVNNALAELKAEGKVQEIVDKYISAE